MQISGQWETTNRDVSANRCCMFLITFAALILPRWSGFLRCYISSVQAWHWSAYCLSTEVTFGDASVWAICASVWVDVSAFSGILFGLLDWIRLDCVVLCPGQNVLCVRTDNYVVGEIGWNSPAVSPRFFGFFFNWSWLDNRLVRRQLSLRLRGVSWNKWAALKKINK